MHASGLHIEVHSWGANRLNRGAVFGSSCQDAWLGSSLAQPRCSPRVFMPRCMALECIGSSKVQTSGLHAEVHGSGRVLFNSTLPRCTAREHIGSAKVLLARVIGGGSEFDRYRSTISNEDRAKARGGTAEDEAEAKGH
ncbi:hypothetical protein BHM03_00031270 [Ensete ventricosum]|nr:hypothetical protein BHM03_00031270 [Ensete ventricosum]